jgi:hypothetical protein
VDELFTVPAAAEFVWIGVIAAAFALPPVPECG